MTRKQLLKKLKIRDKQTFHIIIPKEIILKHNTQPAKQVFGIKEGSGKNEYIHNGANTAEDKEQTIVLYAN